MPITRNGEKPDPAADRYLSLFNDMDQGFCIIEVLFDETGKAVDYLFLQINSAFEKQTGLSNVIGKKILDLQPAQETHWFDIYGQVVKNRQRVHFENFAASLTPSGQEMGVWYEVLAYPFGDPGENQVAVIFNDITERKKAEEKLRAGEEKLREFNSLLEKKVAKRTRQLEQSRENLQQINHQLQDSISRLESFNYIASHDLQEPLRKIETFSALLGEYDLKNETLERYLTGIHDSSARMRRLINDLLTYSRLDRTDNFESTDLNQILKQAMADYEMAIQEKDAVITSDTLPVLSVIPFQIYQLFSNLIGNSLKFADSRPEITITCRMATEIPVPTGERAQIHGPFAEITFSDNGIGFDNQYADRIFQVFQRLHSQTRYPGTGIGLSIVDRVVKNHNGLITATGEKGKGAVFVVYLPVV